MTIKPVPPVKRDEKIYSAKLVAFLRVNIQAPLSRIVIKSTSVAEILQGNLELEENILNQLNFGAEIPEKEFATIAAKHTKKFRTSMGGAIPDIDLRLANSTIGIWLNAKTQENVELITGMNQNQFNKFAEKMNKLTGAGAFDRQAVAKAAQDSFRIGRNRAKLIGRDQVSKAYGELNMIRQKEVGFTKYRWLTSGDERVRESHKENNGRIFEWGNPPATGHPSHDVNCRCTAVPVLD